jgi:hypothetical protein
MSSEILLALEMQSQAPKIAVLNLVGLDDLGQEEANLYTKRLIRELSDDASFSCLSQEEITNLLMDSPINPSSCSSLECGVQAGQILTVPLVAIGNLSKIGNLFTLNMRLIDVTNEKIIKTVREEFRGNEVDFFNFLANIALELTDIPDTFAAQSQVEVPEIEKTEQQPPINDPVLEQIMQQPAKEANQSDQQQTTRDRTWPAQTDSQPFVKKSTSKWKLFGLLVLAGAGAAVYLLKSSDDKETKTSDEPAVTTPLPTPPSFPKKR